MFITELISQEKDLLANKKSKKMSTEKRKALGSLLKYLAPYKVYIALMIGALLVTSSSVLLLVKSLSYIIDNCLASKNIALLNSAFLLQLLIVAALAVGTACRYWLTTYTGENVVYDIRCDLYRHLLLLPVGFYETNKPGSIISKITTDTTLIQNIVGSSFSVALRNLVMLLGAILMLFISSWQLSCYLLLLIPCVIIPLFIFGRKIKAASKSSQKSVGDLAGFIEETIASIRTIYAYTKETFMKGQYERTLSSVVRAALMVARTKVALILLVITLVFGGIVLVLWLGSYHVITGQMSAGELSSFIFLSIIAAGSVLGLSEIISDLQKAAGACERIADFLNIETELNKEGKALNHRIAYYSGVGGKNLTNRDADFLGLYVYPKEVGQTLNNQKCKSVVFKDVHFYYPSKPNLSALSGLNIEIENNQVVAIVGKSGAGKSTIFQLLLRFYEIQKGEILLNSKPIKEMNLKSLREQFAYISQEPVMFSKTVYDNILYGNREASEEEVKRATSLAAATEFIEQLPHGFNTFIGQKGVRLSGGQKQRVAMARAILKDPNIMLLDEPTSSLDSYNEKVLQDSLYQFAKGRMVIIIAHRISTVRLADKIFVMDKGRVAASGKHEELIQTSTHYQALTKDYLDRSEWV